MFDRCKDNIKYLFPKFSVLVLKELKTEQTNKKTETKVSEI